MGPHSVCNCWDFDRGEVVVMEVSMFCLCPGQGMFIDFEDMLCELFFGGPQEPVLVDFHRIELFLCES